MRALAARTASSLVGFFGGCAAFAFFPAAGVAGLTCIGVIDARAPGCVLMGPVADPFLGMPDNSYPSISFNWPKRHRQQKHPWPFLIGTAIMSCLFGMVLEGLPAAVVLIPVVFPISESMGIDPIHFNIVQTAAVGIGLFLPPMGSGC